MRPLWAVPIFACFAFGVSIGTLSCSTRLPANPSSLTLADGVAFGRVSAQLTGPSSRWYPPVVRFFELVNGESGERFRVDVDSNDAALFLKIPPGNYELTRIMINEGAFQAMANPGPTFYVEPGGLNYLGTWRFGINSPSYGRKIELLIVSELDQATLTLRTRYPNLSDIPVVSQVPEARRVETRLYEVTPYPRFWWFRRHHTT